MTSVHPGPDQSEPRKEEAGLRPDFDTELAGYRSELFAYLRRRLPNDDETAADLAQEALARVLKYRDAPQIEDRRAMLFRIANNLVVESHRIRQRQHAAKHVSLSEIDWLTANEPTVEAITDTRQAIEQLHRRTLAGLSPKCRLAFMLNRFDGLSYRQVAERMGISVKMVEKHIARALVACRAAVGERDF